MLYGAIHGAIVFYARSVVEAAAQEALAATQLEGGTEEDGRNAAFNTLSILPNLVNVEVDVEENSSQSEVRVLVQARVENLVLELFNDVTAEAVGPKERFYSYEERD